jgi:hypothetical protein
MRKLIMRKLIDSLVLIAAGGGFYAFRQCVRHRSTVAADARRHRPYRLCVRRGGGADQRRCDLHCRAAHHRPLQLRGRDRERRRYHRRTRRQRNAWRACASWKRALASSSSRWNAPPTFSIAALARARPSTGRPASLAAPKRLGRPARSAGRYRITAPDCGQILRLDADVGEVAQPGEVLFTVGQPTPLEIVAEINEEDIPLVAVGQRALLRTDAFPIKCWRRRLPASRPKATAC